MQGERDFSLNGFGQAPKTSYVAIRRCFCIQLLFSGVFFCLFFEPTTFLNFESFVFSDTV
jgi:hypothetical protein